MEVVSGIQISRCKYGHIGKRKKENSVTFPETGEENHNANANAISISRLLIIVRIIIIKR